MKIRVFVNEVGTHALPANLNDLPNCEVDADENETLHDLAQRAMETLGISVEGPSLLFVKKEVDGVRTPATYPRAVVDEKGILKWPTQGPKDIRVADLQRSYSEGVFDGDPRAFVYERTSMGDSGLVFIWDHLSTWLKEIEGAGGGTILLWEAAKRLRIICGRYYTKWRGRGARTPSSLFELILVREEWDSERLGRLLDISEDDAEDLLEALGYVENDDGLHVASSGDGAELRRRLSEKVLGYDPRSWKRQEIELPDD